MVGGAPAGAVYRIYPRKRGKRCHLRCRNRAWRRAFGAEEQARRKAAARQAAEERSASVCLVRHLGEAPIPLFVGCLSTLLVLAGTIPYRSGGEERPRSTRLALIAIGASFVLAATGFAYGSVLNKSSAPPGSLAGTVLVLGGALVALHLLTITLRMPPESRATAVTVFVLTVILAVAIWQFSHRFQIAD